MTEWLKVASSYFARKSGAPGDSVILEAETMGGTVTTESYQHHGLHTRPPKGCRVVALPVGRGRRVLIVVAEKNYRVNVTLGEGDSMLYSTNEAGSAVAASVTLDNSGKVQVKNAAQSLKTVLDSVLSHLAALTTINCVSGSPVTLSPATIAQLQADKANLAALLKD